MLAGSLTLHELIDRVGLCDILHTPGKKVIGIDDVQGSRKFDSELVGELIFASILARHRECVSRSITPRVSRSGRDWGRSNGCTSTVRYISNSEPESSSFFVFAIRRGAPLDPCPGLCCSPSDSAPESSSRRRRSSPGRAVGIIAPHRTNTASSSETAHKNKYRR
jgi:hypothetical protein